MSEMTLLIYTGDRDFYNELALGHWVTARGRLDEVLVPENVAQVLLTSNEWHRSDEYHIEGPELLLDFQREVKELVAVERAIWRQRYAGRYGTYPKYGPVSTFPPDVTPQPKFRAGGVQYTGATHYTADVETIDVVQHIDALPNEVLWLNFEVASYLIANDTRWTQYTVLPQSVSYVHDFGTGLDTVLIATTAVWGLNSNGAPYFNAEGVAEMDGARMIIGPQRLEIVSGDDKPDDESDL
jgi:hypothetical protein